MHPCQLLSPQLHESQRDVVVTGISASVTVLALVGIVQQALAPISTVPRDVRAEITAGVLWLMKSANLLATCFGVASEALLVCYALHQAGQGYLLARWLG